MVFNEKASWTDHVDYVCQEVSKKLGILKRLKHLLPTTVRETIIFPIIDYGNIVWGINLMTLMNTIQIIQNKAAKIILNKPVYSSATESLQHFDGKICTRDGSFIDSSLYINV